MPINSNWRLEAISKAALAYTRRSFTLKNGTNKVGKSSKDNIRCPSFLCSRNHCKITVENDQLMVLDTSRNGTYVNEIKLENTEMALKHNDIISFGFNISKCYKIKDKNAFIYRVIRDDVETINIFDSDDEDDVDNDEVIVLDSDSNESDDDEITDINNVIIDSSDEDSYDSDASIHSTDSHQSFVVTNIIVNEDIDGNEDEDEVLVTTKTDHPVSKLDSNVPTTNVTLNGTKQNDEITTKNDNNKNTESTSIESDVLTIETSANNDEQLPIKPLDITLECSVERVKQSMLMKAKKSVSLITARPLRKRRRTMTENEYEQVKANREQKRQLLATERGQHPLTTEEEKRIRHERLAQIAQEEKDAKLAAAALLGEPKRTIIVPKVKITQVSRGELLAVEMLADANK